MQKILKWLTPIISMGVAVFIVFFLISINPSEEFEILEDSDKNSSLLPKISKQIWLNHFSKTQKLGYFYPVNEAFIKVDLEKHVIEHKIYKLSASLLDPYQLFCLKEELKLHKLKYYLKRNKDKIELFIYSKERKRLDSLVKALKNYQISTKITLQKDDEKI